MAEIIKLRRGKSTSWSKKNIVLAAGGRGSISTSGGGSNGELTNWDGTKKKTGWGVG